MQRALLREILTKHAPDAAKEQLAERVVKHLELAGFELDEDEQALRKRPPVPLRPMLGGEYGPRTPPGTASVLLWLACTGWPQASVR